MVKVKLLSAGAEGSPILFKNNKSKLLTKFMDLDPDPQKTNADP
jgi:hypothetical protein